MNCKDELKELNGELLNHTVEAYWSRPGFGVKHVTGKNAAGMIC